MTPVQAGAFLTIDLKAIAENRRSLQAHLGNGTECAAVLKADAYGLGAAAVAKELYRTGCRTFFTAYAFEGAVVRSVAPEAKIYLLHGGWEGTERLCTENGLVPVFGSLRQIESWEAYAKQTGRTLPAALHIDTGMSRFGLTGENVDAFCARPPEGLKFELVISHLACADDRDSAKNNAQLAAFDTACDRLKEALGYDFKRSLAASDGTRLPDSRFYKDIARPGIALYDNAVRLDARVLAVFNAKAGQTVGYGATFELKEDKRLAVLSIGYADGFSRSLSNKGKVVLCGRKIPVLGRVSMDLTVVDATGIPYEELRSAETAEIFGGEIPLKEFAGLAGTIDYEILTKLGNRIYRRYVNEGGEG